MGFSNQELPGPYLLLECQVLITETQTPFAGPRVFPGGSALLEYLQAASALVLQNHDVLGAPVAS